MSIPSRKEVEQKLASFEGCLPEILNAKYALAGRQLAEWVRELSAEVERLQVRQIELLRGGEIIIAEHDRLSAQLSALRQLSAQGVERTAQLIAHRAGWADESDARGNLHGMCVVCGVPWPCAYAGEPPPKENVAAQSERIAALEKDAERARKYDELIYAVEKKFPNEARHETALRYIREREMPNNDQKAARLDASCGIERIEPESHLGRQEDKP